MCQHTGNVIMKKTAAMEVMKMNTFVVRLLNTTPQTCKTSFIMFPDQKVCGTDEFTCRSTPGECVPLTWMCDDNPDCSDASDEKACSMY